MGCTWCLTCTGHQVHIGTMKLADYMEKHSLNDEAMGRIAKKDRTVISRYRRGEIIPPAEVIRVIQLATDHAVRFDDWFSGEAA